MDDFDDLKLERPAPDEPPPRRTIPWLPVILVLLVAGAAVSWYFLRSPAPSGVSTEIPHPADEKRSAFGLPAEPGEDIALPPLGESDTLVRELVARLSSHPQVARWLTTDHLIRNFAVVVVNIANGRTPAVHLKAVPPAGAFQTRQAGAETVIDPRSYQRYDGHASAVAAIDARGAARLYATLRPRIEEASQELGVADAPFDRTLERAIVELLKTPIVEGDVRLKTDSVSYAFADPALESLSPAQRQFLRMGPSNVRIVQAKLREIATHLGIPNESLPAETVYQLKK